MSPRRGQLRTGGTRHGLWATQAADGQVVPGEVADNPRTRRCPACGAHVGEPCTAPSRRHRSGRRPITGNHQARTTPPALTATEDR